MRKTLSALLLATCLPTIALAAPTADTTATDKGPHCTGEAHCQGHKLGHKAPKGHRGPGPMANLKLTPEQHQKMRAIMAEQFKSHRDITKKYLDKLPEADKKAMKAELEAAKENSDKSIHALLNAEQQKKYDEMKAKREAHSKTWHENHTTETAK